MTDISFTDGTTARGVRHPLVWGVLALWFGAVMLLTQRGVFMTEGVAVPFPLALAAILPGVIYLVSYRLSGDLRAWVASLDLSLIIGAQTFRVIGVVFLMLWGLGELPTIFALTAGLGDLAVGLLALTVVLAVERRSAGWQGKVLRLVVVGMLDFVAAFGTAIFSGAGFPLRFAGEPLPLLMQQLPMAMIPAFGVPLFIILHIIAWQRLR